PLLQQHLIANPILNNGVFVRGTIRIMVNKILNHARLGSGIPLTLIHYSELGLIRFLTFAPQQGLA
ncbi:MAG: hypothetical protein ACRC2W_06485, partial [Plesiomonas shigelloides]